MSDQSSRFNRLLTIFFALLLAIQVVYLVVGYASMPLYYHRVSTQTIEPVIYNGQMQSSYLLLWLPLFIALAIGILRYRLYDIDIIIRKTLQYTAVTALLSIIYFGSVFLLQRLFSNVTGQQSPLILVVSTLLIASAMYSSPLRCTHRRSLRSPAPPHPGRHRPPLPILHFVQDKKYDARQVVAQFARTARDETDPSFSLRAGMNTLIAELERTIQACPEAHRRRNTLQPEGVRVWLRKE